MQSGSAVPVHLWALRHAPKASRTSARPWRSTTGRTGRRFASSCASASTLGTSRDRTPRRRTRRPECSRGCSWRRSRDRLRCPSPRPPPSRMRVRPLWTGISPPLPPWQLLPGSDGLRHERLVRQRRRAAAPPCAAVPAEGAERAVRFRPLLGPPRSYLRSVSCATRAFEAQFECAASHSFVTSGWCASVAVQRHRRGLQCLRWGGACRRVSSTTRASEVVSRIGNLCQVSAQGAVRAHWDSHLR